MQLAAIEALLNVGLDGSGELDVQAGQEQPFRDEDQPGVDY